MCLVDFSQELLIRTVGNVETPQLQIFMAAFAQRHIDAKRNESYYSCPEQTSALNWTLII